MRNIKAIYSQIKIPELLHNIKKLKIIQKKLYIAELKNSK
jgi:hypothetical protein